MKSFINLAVATLIATAGYASAEVVTKGGASALLSSPGVRAQAAAKPMNCGNCKSEFTMISAPAFKGTTRTSTVVEHHACAECGTKWVTTGHGKAKVETAIHTCAGCKS